MIGECILDRAQKLNSQSLKRKYQGLKSYYAAWSIQFDTRKKFQVHEQSDQEDQEQVQDKEFRFVQQEQKKDDFFQKGGEFNVIEDQEQENQGSPQRISQDQFQKGFQQQLGQIKNKVQLQQQQQHIIKNKSDTNWGLHQTDSQRVPEIKQEEKGTDSEQLRSDLKKGKYSRNQLTEQVKIHSTIGRMMAILKEIQIQMGENNIKKKEFYGKNFQGIQVKQANYHNWLKEFKMGFQNHYNFTENKNKMLGDLKTYNSKYQANGKISSKVFHQFILNDCKYNVIVIGDEPGDDDTNHNQEHTTPRPNQKKELQTPLNYFPNQKYTPLMPYQQINYNYQNPNQFNYPNQNQFHQMHPSPQTNYKINDIIYPINPYEQNNY